jgi:branched-subunit amino acid aminotransferase/4-amino-4-deoxychorismate lyase
VPYFCAPDGTVAETSRGNLFARSAGAAHWSTPPTGRSLLPGVTRAALVALLAEHHEVRVEPVTLDTLRTAELVLWTSSLSGVVAVSAVDGRPLRIDEDLRAGLADALGTGC